MRIRTGCSTGVATQLLSLGADFVAHSLSKYLCSHGDAIGGAVLREREISGIRNLLIYLGSALSGVLRNHSYERKSITKSGQIRGNLSYCSGVKDSHLAKGIHTASVKRSAPLGNLKQVEESKTTPNLVCLFHKTKSKFISAFLFQFLLR